MKQTQIAIDGPAGAGKSTVAKLLSKQLNFIYIDTGAMYRAITLKALELNINLEDESKFTFIDNTRFEFINSKLYMDDLDVSEEIRTSEVAKNVSLVSSHLLVREKLVKMQQVMAENLNVVMDGRDIGYVVLPNAKYKYYITASIKERAKRRHLDNLDRGIKSDLSKIEAEIEKRDHFDSNRLHNPLKQAKDAILIDTSDLSITEVVKFIAEKIREDE
ncbi:cytidylate kinase [Candidatus Izimaplasma bacterium ZiA1]|uniref:(d)CMP kinase n=1 Tax=Candidatus Izimoplasma sp. ZiA1 TaxID=2024899 RepID=UPI000BAA6F69|nr:cytidylate kinase [Candidatus Izimaplasma bacterium ZiA1]